jgi:hypothetical protein
MASGKGFQSKKVGQEIGRALQDLEAAFADWEALSDTPVAKPEAKPTAHQNDVREKTKKLLNQLREQLAELAE